MAETTTQRRRVTPQDIPKRQIKLDIVEPKQVPAVPVWYLGPMVIPIALWILLPAQAGIWLALTATFLWASLAGMVYAEGHRGDLEVDRELVLTGMRNIALGFALGCWAFAIAGLL